MSINVDICISCDDNYAKHAGVVIASILLNAGEEDDFSFYILDGGISDKTKIRINRLKTIRNCDINYIPIDASQFEVFKNIAANNKNTPITSYYILKLAELLPSVNRIIYLDCDVIVRKSLVEFFTTNLDDKYIAGVLDKRVKHNPIWKDTKYINTGVMLIDLNKIRWDNINLFEDYAQEKLNKIKSGKQDIINFALNGKIKIVEDKWNIQVSNFFDRNNYTKDPYIIHYVGNQKPWMFSSYNHFKKEYFKILAHTPWAISLEDKYKWGFWNDICSFIYFIINYPLFFVRPRFWEAIIKSIF